MGQKVLRQLLGSVLIATAVSGFLPKPALAQETGGLSLSFDVSEEFKTRSNPGLKIPAADRETLALTRLGFGLVSETQSQRLNFNLNGTIEAGKGADQGITDPTVNFGYRRESAASMLNLTAFLQQRSVDTLDFISSGSAGDPIFTAIQGTGTQQQTGAKATLELGRDKPFGTSFSLGTTRTEYSDTTDPTLIDNTRDTGRIGFRFDLSQALTLTTDAVVSRRTEEGESGKNTYTLDLGLTADRPDGTFSIDSSFTHADEDNRQILTFGRSRELPRGEISGRIGLGRDASGDINLVGGVDWSQELQRGKLLVSFDRTISGNDNDVESRVSRLSVSADHALTPRLTSALDLGLQDSTETLGGASTRTAEVTASLNYALAQDWGLRIGATHRARSYSSGEDAKSTDAFVSLKRHFDYRP